MSNVCFTSTCYVTWEFPPLRNNITVDVEGTWHWRVTDLTKRRISANWRVDDMVTWQNEKIDALTRSIISSKRQFSEFYHVTMSLASQFADNCCFVKSLTSQCNVPSTLPYNNIRQQHICLTDSVAIIEFDETWRFYHTVNTLTMERGSCDEFQVGTGIWLSLLPLMIKTN